MSSILTEKEGEALLRLFRDVAVHYNAHSLSKRLGLSPRGTLKLLKRLQKQQLLTSRTLGKATYYKPNLEESYTGKLVELLLMREAREKASRYLFEFKDLFPHASIIVLFGSILRTPRSANDIDILGVFEESEEAAVDAVIKEERKYTARPIHLIKQGPEDFRKNLHKGNEVLLNILRHGIVLHGYSDLIAAVSEVTRLP